MDVLIIASGKSSRLFNYTKNKIPKYLLNIDNYPALVTIINYWSKYSKRFFLVIHEDYNELTNYVIQQFLSKLKDQIYIFNYNYQDGTAYTFQHIYQNHLKDFHIQHLLISWCDILPKEDLNTNLFNQQISQIPHNQQISQIPHNQQISQIPHNQQNIEIPKTLQNQLYVFTYGNNCRYVLNNKNEIIPNKKGNVIGIYYIQNFNYSFQNIEKNKDIVEYFNSQSSFNTIKDYKLQDLLDFGDEEKYVSIIEFHNSANKITCRSFNEISINNNIFLKKAINDKGIEIIQNEMNFYKFLNNQENENNKKNNQENQKKTEEINEIKNLFPKILNFYDSAFSMTYLIDYTNLYKYLNQFKQPNQQQENETIIKKVIQNLEKLHNYQKKIIPKTQFLYDIKNETYDKLNIRMKNIQTIINYFPKFMKVNDVYIDPYEKIVQKINKYLFNYYETLNIFEYHIIHGDTNFSNILINPTNLDIKFIDPRGYFSSSKIFGLVDYEYAKILYGISGYDHFNNHHFTIQSLNEKEIYFDIPQINVSNEFIDEHFNKIHKILLVVIWLGLAEYNKNNIWKCLTSYYYGLYLGTLLELELELELEL